MIELLILADDFTGGLDTSVQFANRGIPTRVITDPEAGFRALGDCRVAVVVTQTRHLPAAKAYEIVYDIVSRAVEWGIPHIYKKTDSALRGNVGAELTAALDATGAKTLPFLPAFPANGRTTVNGVHYVNGVPVADSDFGKDPFDPVRESNVARLLRAQSGADISKANRDCFPEMDGLWVFDAETDDDLREAGFKLRDRRMLRVCAGCAGFAAQLPELLGLASDAAHGCPGQGLGLFVLCGSVHPVTRAQLDWAQINGFRRLHISAVQKLDPGYFDTMDGKAALDAWRQANKDEPWLILDANDADGSNAESRAYAASLGLGSEEVRRRVSVVLGDIFSRMLEGDDDKTLLITGGDTLYECMDRIGIHAMEPIAELFPGVVLSAFEYGGKTRRIITKSGGFGRETLLTDLKTLLQNNEG